MRRAIDGAGYFQVQMPDGRIGYPRAGNFGRSPDGTIVTSDGKPLQPQIQIPEDASSITIGADGTVSASVPGQEGATELGRIEIARFSNPAGLQAIGNNLFLETASSGAPQVGTPGLTGLGTVLQNTLENSNVSVVEELVNMITTQRAYEMNSKVISTSDQMLSFITQNL